MRVGILGCTGLVGSKIIDELQRLFKKDDFESIQFFASERSAGKNIECFDEQIKVEALDSASQSSCQFYLSALDNPIAESVIPSLTAQGAVVIDNSSVFRLHKGIPLVADGVNHDELDDFDLSRGGVIANPNCSTIQLVNALSGLKEQFGLRRLIISTYQSVSGAGTVAIESLVEGVRKKLNHFEDSADSVFELPIAFNVIPKIGACNEEGYCGEEVKLMMETRKILNMPQLDVVATVARVPVLYSHSESVLVELGEKATLDKIYQALESSPHVLVNKNRQQIDLSWTPIGCADSDKVFVSRVRIRDKEVFSASGASQTVTELNFWCVSDNLLRGAATNAVEILARLFQRNLTK